MASVPARIFPDQPGYVENFSDATGQASMKGKRLIWAAAILGTVVFSNVRAGGKELSGNELKEFCDNPDESVLCVGYVNGIADAMIYENIFCSPSRATHEQFTLIVKDYLSKHPEKLHIHAGILVLDALAEAFPCPETPMD